MRIVLFRPSRRQMWVERLRLAGYDVKLVHDPDLIRVPTDVVVIDSAVGKWQDYVRLIREKEVPVILLVGSHTQAGELPLAALGVSGIVTEADEAEGLFNRFCSSASGPEDGGITPASSIPLSQRKAIRRLAESHGAPVASTFQVESADPATDSVATADLAAEPVGPGFPPRRTGCQLPSVAAVYAAKGGVGKTTFLLHLAAGLAKEKCRVCLLDLDLMHGTAAVSMDLQPVKTIVDLVRGLDDPLARRACLLPTKAGFSVVAAPEQPTDLRWEPERLQNVLQFLKSEADIVLIDTPAHYDAVVQLALAQADCVMLMTTDDPASVHNLACMIPHFDSLRSSPAFCLIGNRLKGPMPGEQWQELLPWPLLLELPEDSTVGHAGQSGKVLACSPCSPYRLRIAQLVGAWMGKAPNKPPAKSRRLRQWLVGR